MHRYNSWRVRLRLQIPWVLQSIELLLCVSQGILGRPLIRSSVCELFEEKFTKDAVASEIHRTHSL